VVAISSVAGSSFPARLTEVATAADPTTRTFETTFAFDAPPDVLILPGMTALIRISPPIGGLGAGFVLPARAAVIDESGAAFVWKVDPDTLQAHKVAVELGELQGESVVVESGLQRGDLVAATGVNQLREGMQVRRLETP
jgi:multidrug efflux pump subunit AcrA (membrane-fusion protein)